MSVFLALCACFQAITVSCLNLYDPGNPLSSELVDVRVNGRSQRSVSSLEMMPDSYDVVMNVSGSMVEATLERKDVVGDLVAQDNVYKRDWATYANDDLDGMFVVRLHQHYPGSVTIEGYFVYDKTPYLIQSHTHSTSGVHVIHKLREQSVSSRLDRHARSPTSASTRPTPTTPLYLKLHVWADQDMNKLVKIRFGRDRVKSYIEQYYAMLIMSIDLAFQSLRDRGTNIHCRGMGLHTTELPGIDRLKVNTASFRLRMIADAAMKVLRRHVHRSYKSDTFDHAMLLTGTDLTNKANTVFINGQTFQDKICTLDAVSVVEFEFKINNYAAHEIGHSLGARHDGELDNSIARQCKAAENFIMTPEDVPYKRNTALNWWEFSWCSNKMIRQSLDEKTKQKSCLAKSDQMESLPTRYFYGSHMSRDQQCRVVSGNDKATFVVDKKNEAEMCKYGMTCKIPSRFSSRTRVYMPYPGTKCGDNKWCVGKSCILKRRAVHA